MSKYVVRRNIWHTGDNLYYFPAKPGEPPTLVSMDHVTQERIDALLAQGIIAPAKAPAKPKPSADATGSVSKEAN